MTKGQAGELPPWYRLIKAAQYYHVPPWELLDKPTFWVEAAFEIDAAEAEADKLRQRQAEKRQGGTHGRKRSR